MLYLLPKPFKKWCTDKQIDYSAVLRDLKTGPAKGRTFVKRLGAGTKLNLPPVATIRLYGAGWFEPNEKEKGQDAAEGTDQSED